MEYLYSILLWIIIIILYSLAGQLAIDCPTLFFGQSILLFLFICFGACDSVQYVSLFAISPINVLNSSIHSLSLLTQH